MQSSGDPDTQLGFLMHDVQRLLRRNFNRRAQAMGLTLTQGRAIAHLARNEGISQAELAALLEVQPITLTRLIDRMEGSGWVARRPDPNDRRAVQLFLTDKAAPMMTDIQAMLSATLSDAVTGLAPSRQRQLIVDFARMKQNLLKAEASVETEDVA